MATDATGHGGNAGARGEFGFDFHVRYSEVDHRGLMTVPALIDAFQDCSTFQSELLGVGMEQLRAHGRTWVLTHWHIVIDRLPALCEAVHVGTFATGFKGIAATRNFYLCDADGAPIVRADSTWVYMDVRRGRPARPDTEAVEPYGVCEPLTMPEEPRRVELPADLSACAPFAVRRASIDMNEHVNNAQYVQMALDELPRETDVRRLRVDYRRPAVLGDVIVPHVALGDGRCVVALKDPEGSVYAAVEIA